MLAIDGVSDCDDAKIRFCEEDSEIETTINENKVLRAE